MYKRQVYINELNTIPGSLSFYLFAPAGLPYEELLDRLIDLAFKRQRQRDSLTYSYETNIFDTKATGMLKGTKGIKGLCGSFAPSPDGYGRQRRCV